MDTVSPRTWLGNIPILSSYLQMSFREGLHSHRPGL